MQIIKLVDYDEVLCTQRSLEQCPRRKIWWQRRRASAHAKAQRKCFEAAVVFLCCLKYCISVAVEKSTTLISSSFNLEPSFLFICLIFSHTNLPCLTQSFQTPQPSTVTGETTYSKMATQSSKMPSLKKTQPNTSSL